MRRATSIQAFPRCVSPFTGQPLRTRQALRWSWQIGPWPNCSQNIIPLLNIPCLDFPLKTELVGIIMHFSSNWISVFLILFHQTLWYSLGQVAALAEEGIDESSLFFRDSTPSILNLKNFSLVLVDHNVLADGDKALENKVVEIVDHHVRETKLEQAVIIEPTGSCASLVLRTILNENPDFKDASCLNLLRKTILLDTVCLRWGVMNLNVKKNHLKRTEAGQRQREQPLQMLPWWRKQRYSRASIDSWQLITIDVRKFSEKERGIEKKFLMLLSRKRLELII